MTGLQSVSAFFLIWAGVSPLPIGLSKDPYFQIQQLTVNLIFDGPFKTLDPRHILKTD